MNGNENVCMCLSTSTLINSISSIIDNCKPDLGRNQWTFDEQCLPEPRIWCSTVKQRDKETTITHLGGGGGWCKTKKNFVQGISKKITFDQKFHQTILEKNMSFGGSLKKKLFTKVCTMPSRWLMVVSICLSVSTQDHMPKPFDQWPCNQSVIVIWSFCG